MAKFMEKFFDCSSRVIFALGVLLVALCPIYPWYKAYLIPLYLSTTQNFRDFVEDTSDVIISSAKQYGMIEARHIQAMPYENVLPHQKENMTQHVGFNVRYESKVAVLPNGNSKMVYLDVYHPTYPHRYKGNGDRAAEPVYSTVINIAVIDGKKICQVISEKSYTPPRSQYIYVPPIIVPFHH